jgi:predicted lipoprotein with Yx(FWY)xxD motif
MAHLLKLGSARWQRWGAMLLTAVAGFATAALVGIAYAKTITLQVAKNAKVTNTKGTTKRENIVVDSRGSALYTLSGETTHHALCTRAKGCFKFWPPLTVASAKKLSEAPGIKGRLGVWHRNGFFQVTLGGHPLYRFAPDTKPHVATGEGIHAFGGAWHVVKAAATMNGTSTATSTPSTTTTSSTSTTTSSTATMTSSTNTTTTSTYTDPLSP